MFEEGKVFTGVDWLNRELEAIKFSLKHSSIADHSEMDVVSLIMQGGS